MSKKILIEMTDEENDIVKAFKEKHELASKDVAIRKIIRSYNE